MFEKFKRNLSDAMRSFLRIYPSTGNSFAIEELLDFDSNVAVNKIWFRGDSYELNQLYKQLDDNKFSFWGSVPTRGQEIRKIHTGIPKTMINILTNAIVDDLQDVTFENIAADNTWAEISKENKFMELVKKAVSQTFVCGDGAFKISIDTDVSQFPILEFYDADKIEIKRKNGRVNEIVFKTLYSDQSRNYILKEHYGKGYIHYELTDEYGKQVDIKSVRQTADLQDVTWDEPFIMGAYLRFYASDKYDGRGQSVFDAKRDNFDALDEAWSQWMDALRNGRTRTYIPENLLPRNPKTGEVMRGNSFDNRFIQLAGSVSETDNGKIETVSPDIKHESYLQTYTTALDLCLQGIISPSTLGIDTKKLDNAEAQREKEKATLYTRQTVVTTLQEVLPELVQNVFYAYQLMTAQVITDVVPDVPFGEYANPSFESQVETVCKAKSGGIMSIKASIDELYGDSKSDEWKDEEVKRIMNEQGIVEMDEPAVALDSMGDIGNMDDMSGMESTDNADDAEIGSMLDDLTTELDSYDLDDEQMQNILSKLDTLGGAM